MVGFTEYVRRIKARRRAAQRARERRAVKTAFVLSGGGVLGAVQVGHLLALLERGIVPDMLVGTSVGCLNASYIAANPTAEGARELARIWTGLRSDDIFPGSAVRRVWQMVARGDHICSNDGLRRLIERLAVRTFEETAVPLHVGATNLRTGEERWFSSGPLMPAMLASCALPGIFPPVEIDGDPYIDGGVVNNVPVSRAIDLDATRVYVLTCAPPAKQLRHDRPPRRPLDVMVQAFAHARAARSGLDLARYGADVEIVGMPTFDPGFIRYDDPSHGERLIARSLGLSRDFLARPAALEAPAPEAAEIALPAPAATPVEA